MNTHADRTQENKSQSVANDLSRKQSGSESIFQFLDNRPEVAAQRKLQEMANNSPQAKRTAQLQVMADNYSAQQYQPIQKKKNNTGLPDNLKTGIENLSGYSMNDVKVHYNSDKPAQLNAHAYAQGTDIHLAPGQGKHLSHEAWHIVQQKQDRVKPTLQMMGGVKINDDKNLEKEADVMGTKASKSPGEAIIEVSQFKGGALINLYNSSNDQNPIQRQEVIQRIIVVADTQLDFNQFVGVYQMLANGIDERVTLLSILGNSDIQGEQIGLRGHGYGNSGKYANMEAKDLAEFLKDAGVNESNPVIDLLSCKSGKGGGASYAEQFATEMGHSTTVFANKGLGVLMDDGYSYSKRDRTPEEAQEYSAISTECATEVETAKKVADEGKALLSAPHITESEVKDIFLEYGPRVLAVAGNLYRRLYAHQRKIIAAHEDPDSGLYVSPKRG